MKINVIKKECESLLLPEIPFIIKEEDDFILVTRWMERNEFCVTYLCNGRTYKDEDITEDFIKEMLSNHKWKILESELIIKE